MKKINVASLFSGCGGMDIGFEGDFSITHESLPNLKLKISMEVGRNLNNMQKVIFK